MINTIFYFVSTYDTYKQQWDNGEISSKTIVFIEDIKAIYKNNKRYGSMSDPDLYTKFEQFYNSTYDDSDLRDQLARVEGLINDESNRLSGVIRDLDSDIQDKVTDMFDDATWVRNNVAQNEYLHQDMNWDDQIHAYLQQVGYWTTDDQGNTVTQWSKIQQNVDSIDLEVSGLTEGLDGRFETVQSNINQSVDTKIQTAKTEISNTYARGEDVNGVKQVIEWMYSGLKSSAGPEQSIAQIISAGKNSLIGAISDMRTQVNKLENGDYVSTGSLTTQIENYITGQLSTAGLITETTLADAFSTVFARLDDPNNSGASGISALETRVYALETGGLLAETDLVSAITNHKTDIIASAGLATKAQYDALGNTYLAKADLITEIANKAGQITSQAGFITQSTLDSAIATVNAKFQDPANNITGWSTLTNKVSTLEGGGFISENDLASKIASHKEDIITSAGLATSAQIEGLGDTYLAKANLVTAIANKAGEIASAAGLQLTSELGRSVATLISENRGVRAEISAIAAGGQSVVTVNANNINMDADHTLSLSGQFVEMDADFYSAIADNITLSASKINIASDDQLDLSAQEFSLDATNTTIDSSLIEVIADDIEINAENININSRHQLNITGDGIALSNSAITALNAKLGVDSIVTNTLESGTGTFKGNVEAKTFTAGGYGEPGIVVQSGNFNPAGADTSKMYFAYDPTQNAPNLYVYDSTPDPNNNNNPVGWRSLSFANAMKSNTYYASTGWYVYNHNGDNYIKKSTTSLSAADFQSTTLYIAQDNNCYYDSNDSSTATAVNGYYYRNTYNASTDETYFAPLIPTVELDDIYDSIYVNNQMASVASIGDSSTPMLQYLEDDGNGRIIVAEIKSLFRIPGDGNPNSSAGGSVYSNQAQHVNSVNRVSIQSPIHIQSGVTYETNANDCANVVYYSNDAVLSYNINSSTGAITNIQRGFAFITFVGENDITVTGGGTLAQAAHAAQDDNCEDIISVIVSSNNRIYDCTDALEGNHGAVNYYSFAKTVTTAGDCDSGSGAPLRYGNCVNTFGSNIQITPRS